MCKKCEVDKDAGRCPRCGSLPAGYNPKTPIVCEPCRRVRETNDDGEKIDWVQIAIDREIQAGRER